jgi:hypothetical protein
VTRRPLVLQLVKVDDPGAAEYGEFVHVGGKKWLNFGKQQPASYFSALRYGFKTASALVWMLY